MSEAAFTDSTTASASPAPTDLPTSGSSRKTMSPSASCAWSVMPMVSVPSASTRTHSCDSVYLRSAGKFMKVLRIQICFLLGDACPATLPAGGGDRG
ncbi:hypothetical protein D9M71_764980 [compost metagenome]